MAQVLKFLYISNDWELPRFLDDFCKKMSMSNADRDKISMIQTYGVAKTPEYGIRIKIEDEKLLRWIEDNSVKDVGDKRKLDIDKKWIKYIPAEKNDERCELITVDSKDVGYGRVLKCKREGTSLLEIVELVEEVYKIQLSYIVRREKDFVLGFNKEETAKHVEEELKNSGFKVAIANVYLKIEAISLRLSKRRREVSASSSSLNSDAPVKEKKTRDEELKSGEKIVIITKNTRDPLLKEITTRNGATTAKETRFDIQAREKEFMKLLYAKDVRNLYQQKKLLEFEMKELQAKFFNLSAKLESLPKDLDEALENGEMARFLERHHIDKEMAWSEMIQEDRKE